MWLRLGQSEILNLEHVTSIKRIDDLHIEIHYLDPQATRTIRFDAAHDCEAAFERMIENMIKLNLAME